MRESPRPVAGWSGSTGPRSSPDAQMADERVPDDDGWQKIRSCGVRIDAIDLERAALRIVRRQATGAVHLCNAYTLSLATREPALASALERGSLNLPDGMPLVWISRRLGLDQRARVYGPDLMARALDVGQRLGTTHYLLGSTPEVLQDLEAVIARRWPGARVVGAESPPLSNELDDFDAALDRIIDIGPDVVWIGLGTPKQDLVADRLARRSMTVAVSIGAAFDFLAGAKPQAPLWMQQRGLEWAYRLATEPRRLWRRYLVGNSRFIWANIRQRPHIISGSDQETA
jgi:N-acetylglucosaminyldiphosphoundecaprenol N-acetyl-beta-D-mannosaminyltransferase